MASENLILKPQFSKILLVILLFIHLGAVICLWNIECGLVIKILATAFIASYLFYLTSFYVFRIAHHSITTISCHPTRDWELQLAKGKTISAKLKLNNCIVTRYFILLNFKIDQRWRKNVTTPLFFDSESPENLRKLRVILLSSD